MQRQVVLHAAVGGLAVALLAAPYVWHADPRQPLALLRLAFLPPLAIVALQMALAWTPLADGQPMLRGTLSRKAWLGLAAVGLVLAALEAAVFDPLLEHSFPGYLPNGRGEVLIGLPWFALFQPLLFTASVYAFAVRFHAPPYAGIAAVALVRVGLVLAQLPDALALSTQALLLGGAALHGLVGGGSYRYCGFAGPCVLALITTCRFFVTL
jgi:hypothetical protein